MIKKTNKRIGIPLWSIDNGIGVGKNHYAFIERFGIPIIISPHIEKENIDMLYLPGGLDLYNPNEIPQAFSSNTDVFKQFFFDKRLSNYVNDTPIFGVCLGAQQLASHFGCKITQDLLYHSQSNDRWEPAHKVESFNSKNRIELDVNSHHHQCIVENNITDNMEILFVADNEDSPITGDGRIVEAFKIKDKNIYGVQWHPEELYDDFSISVINNLLK